MADHLLERYRGRLGRFGREVRVAHAEQTVGARAPEPPPLSDPGAGNAAHQATRRQVMAVLDDSKLDEDEKQRVLAGITCPCCSGGGASMVVDLKRNGPPLA